MKQSLENTPRLATNMNIYSLWFREAKRAGQEWDSIPRWFWACCRRNFSTIAQEHNLPPAIVGTFIRWLWRSAYPSLPEPRQRDFLFAGPKLAWILYSDFQSWLEKTATEDNPWQPGAKDGVENIERASRAVEANRRILKNDRQLQRFLHDDDWI